VPLPLGRGDLKLGCRSIVGPVWSRGPYDHIVTVACGRHMAGDKSIAIGVPLENMLMWNDRTIGIDQLVGQGGRGRGHRQRKSAETNKRSVGQAANLE